MVAPRSGRLFFGLFFGLLFGPFKGPLAPDSPTLSLAHATPDPKLLTILQGVLETVVAYYAAPTDLLGLAGTSPPLGKKRSGSTPRQLANSCQDMSRSGLE